MTRNNFTPKVKQQARDRAGYVCEVEGCEEFANEVDHKEECWENENGGDNSLENAQVLCRKHHREKTSHSTHLRCKGKRFSIQKGRPKSGKIKSRSKLQSRPFQKHPGPSVLSRSNPSYRGRKFGC